MEPGKFYHIYNHANGNENLFRTDENYQYFLKRYAYFINSIAATYAYCLMPNHIHFLIQLKTEPALEATWKENHGDTSVNHAVRESLQDPKRHISKQFSNLFSSYTQSYNQFYRRRGSLFMSNFKRNEITDDNYLTSVILYIHANPVRHGFVKGLSDWRWSSYKTILLDKPTALKREEVLQWFGNRNEYRRLHQQSIDLDPGIVI